MNLLKNLIIVNILNIHDMKDKYFDYSLYDDEGNLVMEDKYPDLPKTKLN